MNHVAESIIKSPFALKTASLLFLIALLTGCGANSERPQVTVTPQLEIIGDVAPTENPVIIATSPAATPTASPTPLATPLRSPTPRPVTVSRVDPNIDPRLVTPVAEGASLPNLELVDVDGNTIRLAEFEEKEKPLVLNFWSVGCGSCFYEFPLLANAMAYHGSDTLGIVSINIADMPEETRLFAEQLGANFAVIVDSRAELFTTYFNGAVVPTTIFVNAGGTVAEVMIGPFDAYNLDLQLQALGLPPMPVGDDS